MPGQRHRTCLECNDPNATTRTEKAIEAAFGWRWHDSAALYWRQWSTEGRRFLTCGFAFGCWRSMQLKAEGLAKGWNFWNSANLSENFVTKILEWSKCMFVRVFKKVWNLYYIISIRVFQKPISQFAHPIPKNKIPNPQLHLQLWLWRQKFFHLRLR